MSIHKRIMFWLFSALLVPACIVGACVSTEPAATATQALPQRFTVVGKQWIGWHQVLTLRDSSGACFVVVRRDGYDVAITAAPDKACETALEGRDSR